VGAGPVWERALPANFFFTAWLTHHPRRGGLRSAADPHPSWVPSFRQEPRSPGSLGAGPLCRFADPASPGALTARERCAVFAGRARSHTGPAPTDRDLSHRQTHSCRSEAHCLDLCQRMSRAESSGAACELRNLKFHHSRGGGSAKRHKRPAPSEPGDRGSWRQEGTQDGCGSAAERSPPPRG